MWWTHWKSHVFLLCAWSLPTSLLRDLALKRRLFILYLYITVAWLYIALLLLVGSKRPFKTFILYKFSGCLIKLIDFSMVLIWLGSFCWFFNHHPCLNSWNRLIHFNTILVIHQIGYFGSFLAIFYLASESTCILWNVRANLRLTALWWKLNIHWTSLRNWLLLTIIIIDTVTIFHITTFQWGLFKFYMILLEWFVDKSLAIWYNTLRNSAILFAYTWYLAQFAVVTLWNVGLYVALSFFQ
jgi:hypothetical protein